jgi:hypothetical protein
VPLRFATTLRYFYLAYFSKPVAERVLYRAIRRVPARRILEIGIGDVSRTLRLIGLAGRLSEGERVRYAAIDLFEARGADRASLTLKEAHRLLKGTCAQIQLIPGDPAGALAQAANSLANIDLVVISAGQDDSALSGAWFYLPRMLHASSVVFREVRQEAGGTAVAPLDRQEIQVRADRGRSRRAA